MRKKIFSALMLVAFFAATSSTLVSCKDYDEEISAVNTRIDNLDDDLSADIAALETQLNTAKTQLEATIAANKTLIENLQTKHDADVATLNGKIAENNQKIVDLTARVAALESAMTTAQAAIKNLEDNKADKSALNAAIADAAATHAALTGDIKKLQEADQAIITAYKAADDALEAKITAAYQAADKELAAAYIAADKDLKKQIDANAAAIKALQDFQKEQLANNTAQQGAIDKNAGNIATNTKSISDLAAKEAEDIKKLNEDLTAFKSTVADTYATKAALAEGMEEANKKINAVNDKINLLNVLISKRLTSIVFAPHRYIDGVECIDFTSLKYKSWGDAKAENKGENEAFLRDFPTDAKYSGDEVVTPDSFLIDDGTITATYYVNPSGVKAENIASLEYIQDYATNDLTRQDNEKDGVVLKVLPGWTVENGKLTVKLTKTAQEKNVNQINNGNKDFTIVALKANIAKEQLAAGEESAAVYSDWARLSESVGKVRIHKKDAAENAADAHFYAFSDIYTEFKKETNPSIAAAYHDAEYPSDNAEGTVVKTIKYNETFNLNSLDAACDGTSEIDYKSYGLKFEHNLVEYNVLNEGNTADATNQSKYAKITKDENGNDILSSCAADGTITTGDNRDAIGKTPVIQVVLKDTVNNQVVDVRFYRVEWAIKVPEAVEYNDVPSFAWTWSCGGVYGSEIREAEVNKFYAKAIDGGYDQNTFHALFEIDEKLYNSVEAAKNQTGNGKIGTVKDNYSAEEPMQAHNIVFDFDNSVPLTAALYNGTPATLTGYIVYKFKTGSLKGKTAYIIKVTGTVTYKDKHIESAAKYNESAWNFQGGDKTAYSLNNGKKYVTSNPTLTTNVTYGTGKGFTDAQFINDLLNNYIINGAAPTSVSQLLKNQDKAQLIFDKDRLKDLMPGDVSKWTVSANGLTLYYNDVEAAYIENNKLYLFEALNSATPGKGGKPSDGALLLVNYTADETTDVNTIKNAVPLKLVGTQCSLDTVMDKYLVRFEKPLTPITSNVTLEVKDQITTTNISGASYSGSVATPAVSGLFGLKEAFGQYRTVLGDGATPGLADWYIVESPKYPVASQVVVDGVKTYVITDAKTNLTTNGTIGSTCDTKITDLKNSAGQQYWQIALIECADGQLHFQFQNLHGNALLQPVKIQFDVTISTKWLKNIKYTVTVTVQPNTNPGGAK